MLYKHINVFYIYKNINTYINVYIYIDVIQLFLNFISKSIIERYSIAFPNQDFFKVYVYTQIKINLHWQIFTKVRKVLYTVFCPKLCILVYLFPR